MITEEKTNGSQKAQKSTDNKLYPGIHPCNP